MLVVRARRFFFVYSLLDFFFTNFFHQFVFANAKSVADTATNVGSEDIKVLARRVLAHCFFFLVGHKLW